MARVGVQVLRVEGALREGGLRVEAGERPRPEEEAPESLVRLPQPARDGAPRRPPRCPECGSDRVWRDGWRRLRDGRRVQRYLCRDCGLRFSEPALKREVELDVLGEPLERPDPVRYHLEALNPPASSEERLDYGPLAVCEYVGPHHSEVTATATLKYDGIHNRYCRVCAPEGGAKNSASPTGLGPLEELHHAGSKRAAGATETDTKSLLFQYAWWLKKQGYAESTIVSRVKLLRILAKRGANLLDPESVKEVIARQDWSEGRKANAVDAYTSFLQMHGMTWNPPCYKRVKKLPFIPTETEIDQLIAGCGPTLATLLQLLKETGMRIGEAWRLKWTDIDFVNGTVRVTSEKGGEPRIFKLSSKLLAMLKDRRRKTKSDRVFGKSLKSTRRLFYKARRNVARKLKNPRILRISFHTIRHWKATTLYHQTKDILYVMKFLGHKNIKNTLIYVQLEEAIYRSQSDEFICKVAETVEEAKELIEAGFEYVCDFDGVKLFRKRK